MATIKDARREGEDVCCSTARVSTERSDDGCRDFNVSDERETDADAAVVVTAFYADCVSPIEASAAIETVIPRHGAISAELCFVLGGALGDVLEDSAARDPEAWESDGPRD
jgi:hypothetical protein